MCKSPPRAASQPRPRSQSVSCHFIRHASSRRSWLAPALRLSRRFLSLPFPSLPFPSFLHHALRFILRFVPLFPPILFTRDARLRPFSCPPLRVPPATGKVLRNIQQRGVILSRIYFSSHPQTLARKCAIFTRLGRISIIHGCSSMRHGLARRFGSFSRLSSRQPNPTMSRMQLHAPR